MPAEYDSDKQLSLIDPRSVWYKGVLVLILTLAVLIRVKNIQAIGHLVERDFTSAIFARAFYFQDNDQIAPWRQTVAATTKDQQPVLEPPITEYLVSLIYRVLNTENMSLARYLTNTFWILGGIFMYKIARYLLSPESAVVAVGYYLFAPMGVIISRSFQPDALMMMAFLMSLYAILLYFDAPSTKRMLLAATLTGITLLIRPLVFFTLFFAFLALSVYKKHDILRAFDRSFFFFWGIACLIPFAYYGYGIFFADFLRWKVTSSFRPHLLSTRRYWQSWFELGAEVAGHTFLISALLGFLTLRKNLVKALVVGLSIGYVVFGLVFNYHIITHPYYHIQIFPIIGLCAAPFIVTVLKILRSSLNQYWWVPAVAIFLFGLYFSYLSVKNSLYKTAFEDPALASQVGDLVHHSTRTVFVAHNYGVPLEYYGELGGAPWPVRIDDPYLRPVNERELSFQERLDSLGFQPEYFVITDFDLYNRKHQDLQSYLEENCSVYAQTDQYLIYQACSPIPKG